MIGVQWPVASGAQPEHRPSGVVSGRLRASRSFLFGGPNDLNNVAASFSLRLTQLESCGYNGALEAACASGIIGFLVRRQSLTEIRKSALIRAWQQETL